MQEILLDFLRVIPLCGLVYFTYFPLRLLLGEFQAREAGSTKTHIIVDVLDLPKI